MVDCLIVDNRQQEISNTKEEMQVEEWNKRDEGVFCVC